MSKKRHNAVVYIFLILLGLQIPNLYVALSNWQPWLASSYPKEKRTMLSSELSSNCAFSCFHTSRGLPQGPVWALLWVTSLLLVPQAPELPHPQAGGTNQLFVSDNSRFPAPSSENSTRPTKDPKTQICPMQLTKFHCPRDRKRAHPLSQCWISFH